MAYYVRKFARALIIIKLIQLQMICAQWETHCHCGKLIAYRMRILSP